MLRGQKLIKYVIQNLRAHIRSVLSAALFAAMDGQVMFTEPWGNQQIAIKDCTEKELFHEVNNEVNILRKLTRAGCQFVPKLIHLY